MDTEHSREHSSGTGDIQRGLELLWGRQEPPTRGPKRGLTLPRITEAAVAIADAEGLDAVSMRRVAAELGVGTMSLYRYVPGKTELLELMLDHVQVVGPDAEELRGRGWRTVTEAVGRGVWELYLEHPWLLHVNQARPLLGPNGLGSFDFALAGLEGTGLDSRERLGVVTAVTAFAVGSARTHVQTTQAAKATGVSDEEFWAAQGPFLDAAMTSGDYPHVAALDADVFDATGEQLFTFGLERLLDGVATLVERRRREK